MATRCFTPVAFFIIGLLALSPGAAVGQLVITAEAFPFHVGEHEYFSFETDNATGQNTAAIEALMALSGPGQFWDFRTIDFEYEEDGTATISDGAVGPGATDDLLGEATLTKHTPMRDPDSSLPGERWLYMHVADDEARELGFVWISDGGIGVRVRKSPDGDLVAPFPVSFGDEWVSEFTSEVTFINVPFPPMEFDNEKVIEVDGWGTMHGPGLEEPVPVLRYKITETVTVGSSSAQEVYFEFHSTAAVLARLLPENDDYPYRADFRIFGPLAVNVEEPGAGRSLALGYPFPNPASTVVTMELTLLESGPVRVAVYDVLGREVVRLVDDSRPAGSHSLTVDTSAFPSGVYVIRADGSAWSTSRRITVVR